MRKAGYENAYEHMKDLTRGTEITKNDLDNFLNALDLPQEDPQKPEKSNASILYRACPATCR